MACWQHGAAWRVGGNRKSPKCEPYETLISGSGDDMAKECHTKVREGKTAYHCNKTQNELFYIITRERANRALVKASFEAPKCLFKMYF